MPHYIRMFKGNEAEWVNGLGVPVEMTKRVFRKFEGGKDKQFEESVYEVEGELDEVQAVAAYLLTGGSPGIDFRFVVRIRREDLEEARVEVSDRHLGRTGIPQVDFAHRDLVGTKEAFERLVAVLLQKIASGADRIRRIGQAQVRHA